MERYKNFDAETEQLIDSYLRRELHGEKRKAFEKRLQNEQDLLDELYLRKDIMVGIQVAEQKAFRKMLISYESDAGFNFEDDSQDSGITGKTWLIIGLAAGTIAAALGISFGMGWL